MDLAVLVEDWRGLDVPEGQDYLIEIRFHTRPFGIAGLLDPLFERPFLRSDLL